MHSVDRPKGKEWSWQENVTMMAQRMSQKLEEAFVFEMKAADAFLPYHHDEKMATKPLIEEQVKLQCQIFVDYFLGTTVALLGNTISPELEFEEMCIEIVRDKFTRVRKMLAEGGND